MTKHRAETDQRRGTSVQTGRDRCAGGNSPFAQIEDEGDQTQAGAERARDIGGTDIAAAGGANVDALRPPQKKAGGNGTQQVGSCQAYKRTRLRRPRSCRLPYRVPRIKPISAPAPATARMGPAPGGSP